VSIVATDFEIKHRESMSKMERPDSAQLTVYHGAAMSCALSIRPYGQ
jgi:hypothetical protein